MSRRHTRISFQLLRSSAKLVLCADENDVSVHIILEYPFQYRAPPATCCFGSSSEVESAHLLIRGIEPKNGSHIYWQTFAANVAVNLRFCPAASRPMDVRVCCFVTLPCAASCRTRLQRKKCLAAAPANVASWPNSESRKL